VAKATPLLYACLEAQVERENKQDIGRKKKIMSNKGLKSLRTVLLPCEEKRKCGIVRYCAEFLSIGNHSPKRKRTKGGLSMKRHSVNKWKLEQISDCWGDYGRDGYECSLV
jgi:hypothetical protein